MYVVSWLGININNTSLLTKLINIASKFCYCSNKNKEAKPQTQGKTSKLKEKTQFSGISENDEWPQSAQKKSLSYESKKPSYLNIYMA